MQFPPRKILVGTDFSEGSKQAADAALALAAVSSASLTLLHAVPLGAYIDVADASLRSHREVGELVGERVKGQLDAEVQRLAGAKVTIDALTIDGPAAQEMARIADEKGYDLIVVGSQGRTGLKHALTGSVAEAVVRHSPVSVLVVRKHAPISRR